MATAHPSPGGCHRRVTVVHQHLRADHRVTMTTLQLIYFNAGGGHRAAAQALAAVISEQGRPWQVRCVNLVEMLDPQARFRRVTGIAPEDVYNNAWPRAGRRAWRRSSSCCKA
jgi:hypothetical protein